MFCYIGSLAGKFVFRTIMIDDEGKKSFDYVVLVKKNTLFSDKNILRFFFNLGVKVFTFFSF